MRETGERNAACFLIQIFSLTPCLPAHRPQHYPTANPPAHLSKELLQGGIKGGKVQRRLVLVLAKQQRLKVLIHSSALIHGCCGIAAPAAASLG